MGLKDTALHHEATCAARPSRPRRMGELLELEFPSIPKEYLVSYAVNFAPRPPPFLGVLCPPAGVVVKPWVSLDKEMALWFEQVNQRARREPSRPIGLLSRIDSSLIIMVQEFLEKVTPYGLQVYASRNSFACPDVLLERDDQALAVFFVDFDNLLEEAGEILWKRSSKSVVVEAGQSSKSVDDGGESRKSVGESSKSVDDGGESGKSSESEGDGINVDGENGDVDMENGDELVFLECKLERPAEGQGQVPDGVTSRLYHYMHMTGAQYGAVTCFKKTWIFKRDTCDSGDCLLISKPLTCLLKALGFVVSEAGRLKSAVPGALLHSRKLFDSTPTMWLLNHACKAAGCRNTEKIMAGVVWDDFDLLADDLHGLRRLPEYSSHASCMGSFKGEYSGSLKKFVGKKVVVKGRDLTNPWLLGFQKSLMRMVKEVDAYLTLHNLQGKCIPRLFSWGFSRGAMFCYIMMNDAGRSRMERQGDLVSEPKFNDCPEKRKALLEGLGALTMVHNRGVLHGDISDSKIVLQKQQDGTWRVSLVGFAQRCYFNPGGDLIIPNPLDSSAAAGSTSRKRHAVRPATQVPYKEWHQLKKLMNSWLMTR